MFERFSHRAREVMALAIQAAQRFHHKSVGTEHILLGLLQEGSGVGATALKNSGVDVNRLRGEIEQLVQTVPDAAPAGKPAETAQAKQVIMYAIEEARAFQQDYIGTEHLLLGLLRTSDGVAAQVLVNLGLQIDDLRAEVLALQTQGMATDVPDVASRPDAEPSAEDEDVRQTLREVYGSEVSRGGGAPSAEWADRLASESQWVYRKADELAHQVYAITGGFPKEEVGGVAAGLRKAALSIPPSLTEADGRDNEAEARWLLNSALVALAELRYLLSFALSLGCLKDSDHETLRILADELDKDLRRLHGSLT